MKEVIVLIGNYGSGKTELALNFALRAARQGKKVELLDLDMVNTYFRLTDRANLVKSYEIRLVSPNFVRSNVETLSLPAEVASAFALDWDTVIFDVGGDPAGAVSYTHLGCPARPRPGGWHSCPCICPCRGRTHSA